MDAPRNFGRKEQHLSRKVAFPDLPVPDEPGLERRTVPDALPEACDKAFGIARIGPGKRSFSGQ